MSLRAFLTEQGYTQIKLKKTKTSHFEIKAKINNIKGRFIIDTGASNSCIGFDEIEKFNLATEDSEHKASGAGSNDLKTLISKKNKIKIGKYKLKKFKFILIDLGHVNHALEQQKSKKVDGIIGADILQEGKAIIDYNKQNLFLKLNF